MNRLKFLWRAVPVLLFAFAVAPAVKAQTVSSSSDGAKTQEETFKLVDVSEHGDTEALVALRNMLYRKATVNPGAEKHTIVVDGTSDDLLLAQKIVDDLNNARPDTTVQWASAVFMTQRKQAGFRRTRSMAVQTFYLTDTYKQANDAVTAARKQMDPGATIYYVPASNAVVARATPEELPQIGKLLHDLASAPADTSAPSDTKELPASAVFLEKYAQPDAWGKDSEAEQTFYLSEAGLQNSIFAGIYGDQVTTALRNILDPETQIYLVRSRNAIVMLTTPEQLLLVQKILNDLHPDRPGH